MKIFGKSKASSKSNPKGTGPELTELMALMTRVAERLEAVEKKMDLMIAQAPVRTLEIREPLKPAPQAFVPSQPFRQSIPSGRPDRVKPVQGQPHGRRERLLHKAVCADCHKDCEIPFKPTGDRPVYCKECFSKRKGGNPAKGNRGNGPAADLPQTLVPAPINRSKVEVGAVTLASHERQVIVTKKGVGKVTISEIVHASERDASVKKKTSSPEKKSKR